MLPSSSGMLLANGGSTEEVLLMAQKPVEDRVSLLENNLRGLPDRVGALEVRVTELDRQFQQFRVEVRDEFSSTREQIRDGDEGTRRLMRVLHEDLVARIALIDRG